MIITAKKVDWNVQQGHPLPLATETQIIWQVLPIHIRGKTVLLEEKM